MSLTVGELQVLLTGDTRPLDRSLDKVDDRAVKSEKAITASFDKAGRDGGKALDKGLSQALVRVERNAGTSGERAGGVLAQGIEGGLIRNSPLIVAAIGGALAAGAPVAIAGAVTLFAGIGAVAAAQSDVVKSAWLATWDDIKSGAIDDAAVLVPVYTRMAGQIGQAFQALRPQLRDAFADAAPGINSLTTGVIAFANNAMPGMVRAVERSRPVMDGLSNMLGDIGTGLTGFFDGMSEHAPAAGAALDALGDILAGLLPALGDILGAGAELAADVLPLVADAVGGVAAAANQLGPVLPAIATGFLAMKIAGSLGSQLGSVATGLGGIAAKGGLAAGSAGKLGGALGGVASVLGGPMGLVIAGAVGGLSLLWSWMNKSAVSSSDLASYQSDLAAAFRESKGAIDGNVRAIAAQKAADQQVGKSNMLQAAKDLGIALPTVTDALLGNKAAYEQIASAADAALTESLAFENSGDMGFADKAENGRLLVGALDELIPSLGQTQDEQNLLAEATAGTTAAMAAQADQAMAAIDSGFAYQSSLNQLEDAQAALAEAQAHVNDSNEKTRTSSEDVSRAQLALSEQSYRTALAFGQQQADLSGLEAGTEGYTRLLQQSTLQELYRLRDAAGPEMAGALNQQIGMLEASGVSLAQTGVQAAGVSERMRDLGHAVTEVPGSKGVYIDAPTADQQRRIENLGYTVTRLPNGKVYVTANTEDAAAKIASIQAQINGLRDRTITITTRAENATPNSGATSRPGAAIGGIAVKKYADGGVYTPMSGRVASFVAPNTWRVIGDRTRDDEAFIPINQSPRSLDILAQTARRMGGQFLPNGVGLSAATGGSTGTGSGNVSKSYSWHAEIKQTLSLNQFAGLMREYEAIYG